MNFIYKLLYLLFPLVLIIARMLKISPERFQRKMIKINNDLVWKSFKHSFSGKDILLLLPHCLQFSLCKFRITFNPDNCIRCGKCDINDILKFRDTYNIHVAIATGGTLARKIVKEIKPKFIIGVACEQDLSLGIYDVGKIPVYGIINRRPEGPCINTNIDISLLEKSLKHFIKNDI